MQKTVVSFGETLWDLFPSGPVLGGAPFNLAYRIHSLGDRGIIASRLGRDELGRRAVSEIERLGMETSQIQWDSKHPTGTVKVSVSERGEPDYVILPEVAYDYLEATESLHALVAAAECFCFGTLVQRAPAARRTLYELLETRGHRLKVVDINLRRDCYSLETVTHSLEQTDVLKMNLDEAHRLADMFEIANSSLPDFCEELVEEWSLNCCVVTLGEYGVFAASRDGRKVYLPGFQVELADTCGSGDALLAGFLHSYLRHRSLDECCRWGNALGALVATQKGATTPVSFEQIRAFAEAKPPRRVEPSLKAFAEN